MATQNDFSFKELSLEDIEATPDLQSRMALNAAVVKDYAEQFAIAGISIPAVTVFYDGDKYWLADGFHRVAAFKSIGRKTIGANVYPGNRRDALLHSLGANAEHGLPRTKADKHRAVEIAVTDPEWGKWSDYEIANKCKVSRPFVAKIRSLLVNVASEKIYKTKHGTVSTMKTENIGRNSSSKNHDTSNDGAPPPMTKEERLEMEIKESSDTVIQLAEENEKLRQQIALGRYEGNEFEKFDIQEELNNLREKNRLLELENKTLRESRDSYQYENSQMIRTIKTLRNKLKKLGIE
jgi:ParB-like chromosome segregation protein Spo0J